MPTETTTLLAATSAQPVPVAPPSLDVAPKPSSLSMSERIIRAWVEAPAPISWLCQHKVERIFRDRIAEGRYVVPEPSIGYRAVIGNVNDTLQDSYRIVDHVFDNGMSAYTLDKIPYPLKGFSKDPMNFLYCLMAIPCMAVAAPIGVITSLTACSTSFFTNNTYCSPGERCGQNWFVGPYVSNFSALALSKEFMTAAPYHVTRVSAGFWRFILVLPEGYIDFSAFSNDTIVEGLQRDPAWYLENEDLREMNGDPPFDAKEIFPRGDQRILSEHVVAAILMDSTGSYASGTYTIYEREIKLNPKSTFYDAVKHLEGSNLTRANIEQIVRAKIQPTAAPAAVPPMTRAPA